jgi:hypothetical protein
MDEPRGDGDDALVSRVSLIEEQPLEERAAAFVAVYDELRAALEGSDSRPAD